MWNAALRACLLLAVMAFASRPLAAAEDSPVEGLQDGARLFTAPMMETLRERMTVCREQGGVELYLVTFADLEDQPMARAQERMRHWSGGAPALMLAFGWGMQEPLLLPNASLGRRYPVGDLSLLLAEARQPFQQMETTLSQKFDTSSQRLSQGLIKLEQERQKRDSRHFPLELFLSLAAVLTGAGLLMGVALLWLQAGSARPQEHFFPEVEVGMRLGAPHGGGLMAQTPVTKPKTQSS